MNKPQHKMAKVSPNWTGRRVREIMSGTGVVKIKE
jgi:hypothetical protein